MPVLEWLGYHRISRVGDRFDTPVSEGEAESEIRRAAVELGVPVRMLPTEKNQTGGEMARPILERAVTDIEAGKAAGLIVVHYDRLSRAELVDALVVIKRIEDAGGQVISAREKFDVSIPEGQMGRDVFLVMSRMQLARQKLYIRASKKRAVDNGIWPMSRVSLGYTVHRRKHGGDGVLKPDPATRNKVVEAFKARARGESWSAVSRILGVGTTGAARIVSNRVYLGEIRLTASGGEEWVNPNAHEPLVTRELWEAAQLDRPRPPRNGLGLVALLTGLTRCAGCGGALSPNSYIHAKGHLESVYRCAPNIKANGRCPAPTIISQRKLDPYVESVVLPLIEDAQTVAAERTDRVAALTVELAAAVEERDLYQKVTSISAHGADAFMAGMETRQAEVDRLERLLEDARAAVALLPNLSNVREAYAGWSVEERRHLLRGSLGAVWVWRGRGPAAERVRLVAKGFETTRKGWERLDISPLAWEDHLPGEIRPAGDHDLG